MDKTKGCCTLSPVLEKIVEGLTQGTVPTIGKVAGCGDYFARRLRRLNSSSVHPLTPIDRVHTLNLLIEMRSEL